MKHDIEWHIPLLGFLIGTYEVIYEGNYKTWSCYIQGVKGHEGMQGKVG